ncbi:MULTISPECIES: hypothetical protein [unclassified Bradyrhizobium]|uniref:hypothetical protein n=1 Tax=unclassified Bradyrhizobium TaxID=2631580 RepID=UPI002916BCC4|nr:MULTISPECIES: hypothetical protein [unclassified Bradyrhizobium]
MAAIRAIANLLLYLIPFSRDFPKCSRGDLREAWAELCITTIFTTMPLWIMPLLGPIIFQTDVSFFGHVEKTIDEGELFIYSAALLGPLIFIITRKYGEIGSGPNKFSLVIAFPHGLAFVLFSAVICVFAGFAFSLMKNPVLSSHESGIKFNLSGVFWASVFTYLFSLYCFFAASAYRNAMTDFVKSARLDEDTFATEWERRSNAQNA